MYISYNSIRYSAARGSFPLDHGGQCKDYASKYLECLKLSGSNHYQCRELSKIYLQCRMEKYVVN